MGPSWIFKNLFGRKIVLFFSPRSMSFQQIVFFTYSNKNSTKPTTGLSELIVKEGIRILELPKFDFYRKNLRFDKKGRNKLKAKNSYRERTLNLDTLLGVFRTCGFHNVFFFRCELQLGRLTFHQQTKSLVVNPIPRSNPYTFRSYFF